jgi:spore germination protein YaaH
MLKFTIISIALISFVTEYSFSQEIKSIHQEQSEYYSTFDFNSEIEWSNYFDISTNENQNFNRNPKGELSKEVFGWNPYWMGTAYYNYDYSLLTEVSYFSFEVNKTNGFPDTIRYWKTTELVDYCHNNNVKVSLTATLFSGHQTFFENPVSVENFIDTIIKLVQFRNADGINIDFEGVSSSQKDNLTNFMIQLSIELHSQIPNSRLSIAIPAVDWSSTFDVAAMNNYVDLFLIMGYEYYWSGSSTAGPGSPKNGGDLWGSYNTTRSINDYLAKGISPEKLCLAVPYYGREWSTESNAIPSETTSSGKVVTYLTYMNNYFQENTVWDLHSSTPVNIYENDSTGWKQCWQNDAKSSGYKYDYVKLKEIGGIGIWALGYDGSYTDLWDMLYEKFTPSGNNICEDVFSDTGGPFGQYYDNEDWVYTIAPKNPVELKIVFTDFDLELNFDTLFIYDGSDIFSTLVGSFTGTDGPQDTLISETGAFTFRFKSDNATKKEGWNAHWTCDNFSSDIQDIETDFDVNIYPNPFDGNITIDFGKFNPQKVEIMIYNILGQEVYSKKFQNTNNSINILTENLMTNSIYILQVKFGNEHFTEKIVKK